MIEPVWWAAFVYTLAKGRVTREIEEWVLWELPLSRALAYQHCCLRGNGQWTVPVDNSFSDKVEELVKKPATHLDEFALEVIEEDFD